MTHTSTKPPLPALTKSYRWQRLQRRAFNCPVCARSSSQRELFWTSRSQCATSPSTYYLPNANHWATARYQLAGQHSYLFLTMDLMTFPYPLSRQTPTLSAAHCCNRDWLQYWVYVRATSSTSLGHKARGQLLKFLPLLFDTVLGCEVAPGGTITACSREAISFFESATSLPPSAVPVSWYYNLEPLTKLDLFGRRLTFSSGSKRLCSSSSSRCRLLRDWSRTRWQRVK
jgi:hypothetical protein